MGTEGKGMGRFWKKMGGEMAAKRDTVWPFPF